MSELSVPLERRLRNYRRWRTVLYATLAAMGLYLLWQVVTWPDVAALANRPPKTTAFIEHYRGSGLWSKKRQADWRWVSSARISSNLKRAVIVSEDIRFFSHEGFDREEIRAALADAWEDKELPRGASTITQQVAKNLWLSPSYNPLRKVKEAILTRQLEDVAFDVFADQPGAEVRLELRGGEIEVQVG